MMVFLELNGFWTKSEEYLVPISAKFSVRHSAVCLIHQSTCCRIYSSTYVDKNGTYLRTRVENHTYFDTRIKVPPRDHWTNDCCKQCSNDVCLLSALHCCERGWSSRDLKWWVLFFFYSFPQKREYHFTRDTFQQSDLMTVNRIHQRIITDRRRFGFHWKIWSSRIWGTCHILRE